MQIHFYITPNDLERYQKEGACYIKKNKASDLFHISFNAESHTIEKTLDKSSDEYILRKIS